jgi:hypothetical protein
LSLESLSLFPTSISACPNKSRIVLSKLSSLATKLSGFGGIGLQANIAANSECRIAL